MALFGSNEKANWSVDKIMLPRMPIITLMDKKLKSLSKKYFSIPEEFLSYYPVIPDNIAEADSDQEVEVERPPKRVRANGLEASQSTAAKPKGKKAKPVPAPG